MSRSASEHSLQQNIDTKSAGEDYDSAIEPQESNNMSAGVKSQPEDLQPDCQQIELDSATEQRDDMVEGGQAKNYSTRRSLDWQASH